MCLFLSSELNWNIMIVDIKCISRQYTRLFRNMGLSVAYDNVNLYIIIHWAFWDRPNINHCSNIMYDPNDRVFWAINDSSWGSISPSVWHNLANGWNKRTISALIFYIEDTERERNRQRLANGKLLISDGVINKNNNPTTKEVTSVYPIRPGEGWTPCTRQWQGEGAKREGLNSWFWSSSVSLLVDM